MNPDPEKLTTRGGVLELLGETVLQAQSFERFIGYCVGLIFSDTTVLRASDILEIEKAAARVTLGRFVARLRQRQVLPDDLEERVRSVLERRNRMVHGIAQDPEFDLETPDGCAALGIFLLQLAIDMHHLDLIFFGCLRTFAEHLGVSKSGDTDGLDATIEALGYELRRRDA